MGISSQDLGGGFNFPADRSKESAKSILLASK